jgi:CIC family chloride channel protein
MLVAAGAAAGLATAFSAPIAGGVFVLEELVKRFQPRTAVATLLASAAGFMSADLLLGGSSFKIFSAPPMRDPRMSDVPLVVVVGLLAGAVGMLYNRAVMASLKFVDASRLPREVRAGAIGGLVGLVGYYAPSMVGGGDQLTQRALFGAGSIAVVAGVLVLRFALSVVSYASATPGGIFAPMLVIGSHLGLLVGLVGRALIPSMTPDPAALALIGMAAFFTATVRAPITGIVLATELTGVTNQLPPTLGACAVAMLVAMMLRCTPIYDALTTRAATAAQQNADEAPAH